MYINDLEKPEIKGHQFTKIAGFLTDGGENKQKSPNYTPEQMPYSFKAYDDDGEWYLDGIAYSIDYIDYDLMGTLGAHYGVTLIKIYDRKNNKYIDSIG